MIGSEDANSEASKREATLLLYDYLKHLTTLSLLALGGVLSLSQAGVTIDRRSLILIVGLVAAGGAIAFVGADAIVKSRAAGLPAPASLRWARALSTALFGAGTGAFSAAFLDAS